MSQVHVFEGMSATALHAQLLQVQSECADSRSCQQKRYDRMPQELRDVYSRLAIETDEYQIVALRAEVWKLRKEWVAHARVQTLTEKVKNGSVLHRSKKLHTISSFVVHGQRTVDQDVWKTELKNYFDKKCGVFDFQMRCNVVDFLAKSEGMSINITIDHVAASFRRLRRKSSLDLHGVCVRALELLFVAQPLQFSLWLSHFAGNSSHLKELEIRAQATGKTCGDTAVDDVRVILPLPSILALLDALLPYLVESHIDRLFPQPKGVWFGARTHSQVLDISHGLTSVIEKGLDLESNASIGQSDIRAFYDSVLLLRSFQILVANGMELALAAACLRHQLLPSVFISIGSLVVPIGARSIGSLTGSRLAGMAARVPVQEVCCRRAAAWQQWGFVTPRAVLTMSTYVDNLFVASKSAYGASMILDDAERELQQKWSLTIKSSSRLIMVPQGADDISTTNDTVWPVVDSMAVLGHYLQSDGGIDTCYAHTVRKMWGAFFANCVRGDAKRLPLQRRVQLLQRAVIPVLRFRWTRWPFGVSRANQLDTLQKQMLKILLGMRYETGESVAGFFIRRGREVAALQRSVGKWSDGWARAVVGWHAHISRERNSGAWPALVKDIRQPSELSERRRWNGSPATRRLSGFIRLRWYESIDVARSWLAQPTSAHTASF